MHAYSLTFLYYWAHNKFIGHIHYDMILHYICLYLMQDYMRDDDFDVTFEFHERKKF